MNAIKRLIRRLDRVTHRAYFLGLSEERQRAIERTGGLIDNGDNNF